MGCGDMSGTWTYASRPQASGRTPVTWSATRLPDGMPF
jgi:hypothetical protein